MPEDFERVDPTFPADLLIKVVYCPPDWTVARVTRAFDVREHARRFIEAHGNIDGDAWAQDLFRSGLLQAVCDSAAPCEACKAGSPFGHLYSYVLNIYADGARLGGREMTY